ncbi:MAG: hypothetical protein IIC94_08230 [Chloroflexi bacterium]|nr:hypothetical protein [Chloroflexota bacterium]
MDAMRAGYMYIGESNAAHRAAQVRTRIATFRELADFMRNADTALVLDTMEVYTARNAEEDLVAVDLATRGVAP